MPFLNSSNKRLPARKGKKKGGCFKLLIILAIIGGIGYYLYNSSFFNVGQIEIMGLDKDSASETYGYLVDSTKDKKISKVEKGYLSKLIEEKFPNLKLNEVKYGFPNKVKLDMSKRDEKYAIQASNGTFIADSDGVIIEETHEASPSVDFDIIYDKSLEVGQKVEDATLKAGMVYANVNQTVKIENDQVNVNLDNGGKIILPKNPVVGKVNEYFTMLQKIVQKYTIDNRPIDFIDLRFSKPVIKYK